MRDPNRISLMCKQLEQTWALHPDMRLGQLVVNAIRPRQPCPEVFSTEDSKTWAGLEALASRVLPPTDLPAAPDPSLVTWAPCRPASSSKVRLDGVRQGWFEFEYRPTGVEQALETCATLLELSFVGEYGRGSAGNGAASAMFAAMAPWLFEVRPDVVILDLVRLSYEWGNRLWGLAQAVAEFDVLNPIAVVWVGGPASLTGLRSLLGDDVLDSSEAAHERALHLACTRAAR